MKSAAILALNDSQMPDHIDANTVPPVKANADGSYTLPNPRDYKITGS